jgi:hypothetical protein
MITRKLHITNYQGSATLINWPYIGLCQIVKFEYLIPGGAKQSKTESNINKSETDLQIWDVNTPNEKVNVNVEAYNAWWNKHGDKSTPNSERAAKAKGTNTNPDQISDISATEKQKWQAIVASKEYQDELDRVKLKYNSNVSLAGNWENSSTSDGNHFNSNIGVPASLSSWTDSHKSSVGYYVQSITDTIKGGLLTSELELIGWIKYDNPQLEAALKK